ncbi:MAG: TRAP transporter substrate-binding protein DctP [Azospirillaceae bacterium]|nr:TRAP transporter substrate-binding protein DctP [Azospirillaceae bacterium]
MTAALWRRPVRKTFALGVIALALGFGGPVEAREILIVAHLYSEASIQHQGLLEANQELLAGSNGGIGLEIKPNGLLGDQDSRLLDSVIFGRSDIAIIGASAAARDFASLSVLSAPFVFRDYMHWSHFKDSTLARDLIGGYDASGGGTIVLGFYYSGFRHVISRMPVRGIGDLTGLRIRVPSVPIYFQFFQALGAVPTPWPFSTINDGFDGGRFDAVEKTLATIDDEKFYERAPNITLTGHMLDTALFLVNAARLAALPARQRDLVRAVFTRLSERLSERIRQRELDSRTMLEQRGVTFFPVDRDALAARIAPLASSTNYAWSGALYGKIHAIP